MRERPVLKIGEFARVGQVSIATLRHYEKSIPLPTPLEGNEQITIQTLSGGLMAYTIHTGADLFLGQAYAALYRWMKDSGYQVIGPPRLVYLQHGEHLDPNQYLTEVQFPVEKARYGEADMKTNEIV